jgi:LCP family protein required for cell wall assembly
MGAMNFNRDPKSKHDSARSSMPGNYPASQPRAGQQKYIPQSNPGLHQDMGMVVEKGSRRKPSRARRWLLLLFIIFFVFFTPFRTTILVLGIDSRPGEEWTGRSDTMIITTIPPVLPQVSMLSIPRDLWVGIPGYGENRINTAHFFAEAAVKGSGPQAAAKTVEANFGIKVPYTVRIRFDGFKEIVDAMGGVNITLTEAMSGLDAGTHHLDGTQALAFVRDRETSDDFWRQKRGQMFIAAAVQKMINPLNWFRVPAVTAALSNAIQTDIPAWLYPRVLYSMAFSAIKGFDSQTLPRELVTPYLTDQGAQVLLPNWDLINPLVKSIFN